MPLLMTDEIEVWPQACAGRLKEVVPTVVLPVLSSTVMAMSFFASPWLKQPTFVRRDVSTLIPGANERELVPANSSAGIDWPLRLPLVQISESMMKRLLCWPPVDRGLAKVI